MSQAITLQKQKNQVEKKKVLSTQMHLSFYS